MSKFKKRSKKASYVHLKFGKRSFKVLLDKVMFLRYLKKIQGRYWGLAAIVGMTIGFSLCFAIKPEMLTASTALSDFGNDFKTAPYFTGTVFFTAYGLWRWRKYLAISWQRTMPVTGLMTLTIIGLYLVALMPIGWKPIPFYIHLFGVSLAGFSMLATVVLDQILTKTQRTKRRNAWRFFRLVSFVLIISGGFITFSSVETINWYELSLVGEVLMLLGYFIWIIHKTFQGQGERSVIGKLLKNFVLIS